VQYETKWDEGMGSTGGTAAKGRFGEFKFSMVDQLQVCADFDFDFGS
jgi:hypothetical protein